jgi:hypothetical protein
MTWGEFKYWAEVLYRIQDTEEIAWIDFQLEPREVEVLEGGEICIS